MVHQATKVCLIDKSCEPCQGGVPPLDLAAAKALLEDVGAGWQINNEGRLACNYPFKDFMGAMNFANRIAEVAEKEAHHPDVTIAWGRCSIEIWTHKINGLTESDFVLAAKIAALQSS